MKIFKQELSFSQDDSLVIDDYSYYIFTTGSTLDSDACIFKVVDLRQVIKAMDQLVIEVWLHLMITTARRLMSIMTWNIWFGKCWIRYLVDILLLFTQLIHNTLLKDVINSLYNKLEFHGSDHAVYLLVFDYKKVSKGSTISPSIVTKNWTIFVWFCFWYIWSTFLNNVYQS